MGRQIIKTDPNFDLYMLWSSIVEAPLLFGSRADMKEYLLSDFRPGTLRYEFEAMQVEERLAKADATGTDWPPNLGCTWDDEKGEIFEQRGYLPRANMLRFAQLYLAAADSPAGDSLVPHQQWPEEDWNKLVLLLEPFEDGKLDVDRH